MAFRMVEITERVRVGRDREGRLHVEVWSAAPGGKGVECDEIVLPGDAVAGLARYLTDAAITSVGSRNDGGT
jgi:hypothetical protein